MTSTGGRRTASKVEVEIKTNCVVGCSHCGTLCEAEALSFPTLEEIKRAAGAAAEP